MVNLIWFADEDCLLRQH